MSTPTSARELWALGDYDEVAKLIAGFGPDLVGACGISAGQRVLDVGAGSGDVAIAAARTGADVVASDITPELFGAGRRAAAEHGVELEWVEADAADLPFGDGEFDVVTSAVGAMFAPDHQKTADELLRVSRPGGLIGMINWPPYGFSAEFFGVFARHNPPPPTASPALLWGTEQHVRDLFGDRVSELAVTPHVLEVRDFASPEELGDHYKRHFPPTIATFEALKDDPQRVAALDRDFDAFLVAQNRGELGGPARFEYQYVRVVAKVRAHD
jgi:ubiquinone/menaquinone biosynthesis C-methylase UbiE